jgi:hypothetical protein
MAISGGGSNLRPVLATTRAGAWLAAWEAFDPIAIDTRIVLATSADGGASWSAPVAVSSDTSSGIEAGLAADLTGAFVAVWYANLGLGGGDDQDILTSHGSLLPLDDFRCYTAKPTRGSPKFVRIPGVDLVDPATSETLTVDVKKPRQLCAPAAEAAAGGISDPDTHLESYDVKLAKGSPKLVKRIDVHVVSPLGALRVDIQKPLQLLVPTSKDAVADPLPPDPAEIAVDHYRCDKVKLTKGSPKFPKGLRIAVGDQFTDPPRLVELKKPRALCTPVEIGGAMLRTPAARLLCHPAKPVKAVCAAGAPQNAGGFCKREADCGGIKGATTLCMKQPKHQVAAGLHVANDFGSGRVDARKDELVCVPVLITTP